MSDPELMVGAPPADDRLVTLGNWQTAPFNRWSFQRMRELMPTQRISHGTGPALELRVEPDEEAVTGTAVVRTDGSESTAGRILEDTWTDSVLIIHDGRVVLERYGNGMRQDSVHLLMSVTKSVVGCVAGILSERGVLDTDAPVERYVPEVREAGYGGARVRDLLDMRTAVKFSEEYQNIDAEVRQIERHMGWRPRPEEERNLGLYGYLATLSGDGDHGGTFVYRSADTDMLGWVIERAAEARMAELVSDLVWQPLGTERDAEITCDSYGSPVHDGGMSATTRDLARFGLLLLRQGELNGRQIVPEQWLKQALTVDPDIREAFRAGDNEPYLPGGWYRNQFWHVPARSGDVQMCLGIHGQMILVDPHTDTVSVKFSTWPDPQNPAYLIDTIRAFTAVGRSLAGLPEATDPGERQAPVDSGLIRGPDELSRAEDPGPPAKPA